MRSLAILGSTGSIGTQALDVVRRNADRFKVVGLSAGGTNQDLFVGQVREFLPPLVAIADEDAADDIKEKVGALPGVELIIGPDATETVARESEADMVVNGLVGSAGLGPTLAALQSGKTLALANKESLVVGGELVMDLIKGEPERLLPVDSEHAALAMALRGERRDDLKRVVLTGSGGPVPWVDARRALQGIGQGGAPAPGVDHGAEDHDRLGDAHEQGPRGDRGALPVRPGLLADPRPDPPGGRGACHGGVQGWEPACRDGSSRHATSHPTRARVAGAAPHRGAARAA